MKKTLKAVGVPLLLLLVPVVICGLIWAVMGSAFFLHKYFAPKQVEVERQVFENTRSFNQGMVQELENMRVDYMKEKDPNAKLALRDVILHRASGYNMNDPLVTVELRSFVNEQKREKELGR